MRKYTKHYQNYLLSKVRKDLEDFFQDRSIFQILSIKSNSVCLNSHYGVFISLKNKNQLLHGCIGIIKSQESIGIAASRYAIEAVIHDIRFKSIDILDIGTISIEISLLSKLRHVSPEDIIIGVHGVVVEINGETGVFLPEVALEEKLRMSRDLLEHLCRDKMGIDKDSYSKKKSKIYVSTTQKIDELLVNSIFEKREYNDRFSKS
jgi:AmmeMemoRadiSam system protein A